MGLESFLGLGLNGFYPPRILGSISLLSHLLSSHSLPSPHLPSLIEVGSLKSI